MKKVIASLAQLKLLAEDTYLECNIALKGNVYSKKIVLWDGKKFHVENSIDGSKQTLMPKELMNKSITNIGYALTHKALWYETENH